MGKWSDALFKYKVGQRVFLTYDGTPVVIRARVRYNGGSWYDCTELTGVRTRAHESALTDERPNLGHTKETP